MVLSDLYYKEELTVKSSKVVLLPQRGYYIKKRSKTKNSNWGIRPKFSRLLDQRWLKARSDDRISFRLDLKGYKEGPTLGRKFYKKKREILK
jgi:hypothetical protein